MTRWLEAAVRTGWFEAGFPGRPPGRISLLLFEGSPGAHGVVSFHVFRDGDPRPLLIGKLPRDGAARRRLLDEHDALTELGESAPRLAGVAFPRSMRMGDRWGRVATAQPVLPGRVPGGPPEARFEAAREWLARFWRATGFLEGTEAALWENTARSAHFYLETFTPGGEIRIELDALLFAIESRRDGTALCGFAHGAFGPDDLLVSRRNTAVVGWEHARTRELPWLDPLHFALELAARETGDPRRGFVSAFLESGPLRTATLDFVRACFDEGAVPPDLLSLALPATVLAIVHRHSRDLGPENPRTTPWVEVLERCLGAGPRAFLRDALPA